MTKRELLKRLQESISEKEKEALYKLDSGLVIGKQNREALKGMLEMSDIEDSFIDDEKLKSLTEELQNYLDIYMDKREGHKWVILASIYNSYVLEVPMHPINVVHAKMVMEDGKRVYYCPCREDQEGSLCKYCVCRKLDA